MRWTPRPICSRTASALICEDRQLTFAEYRRAVAGMAQHLAGRHAPGDRIAMVMGNGIETAVALMGAYAARLQTAPLNPGYTDRELGRLIADVGPAAIACSPPFAERVRALEGGPDGPEILTRRRGRARHLAMGGGRKPFAAGRPPAAGGPLPDVLHRRHDRPAQGRRAYPQFARLFLPADPRPVAIRVRRRDRPERRADVPYLGPRFHPDLPALHPGDHGDRAAIPAGRGDRATGPAPGQLLRRRAGGDFPRPAGLGRD